MEGPQAAGPPFPSLPFPSPLLSSPRAGPDGGGGLPAGGGSAVLGPLAAGAARPAGPRRPAGAAAGRRRRRPALPLRARAAPAGRGTRGRRAEGWQRAFRRGEARAWLGGVRAGLRGAAGPGGAAGSDRLCPRRGTAGAARAGPGPPGRPRGLGVLRGRRGGGSSVALYTPLLERTFLLSPFKNVLKRTG